MCNYLGIDTSNYTTSVAIFNSETNTIIQEKKLLPVKSGELGLRQSDAVFHHTVQLPEVMSKLYDSFSEKISAVGVSATPRDENLSYMPCFLPGVSVATGISKTNIIPLHQFSHQAGHIVAALYSADAMELMNESFIAFHLSGGTTDALLVTPDKDKIFKIKLIAKSLDIKAGQAVDRVGVMLGLDFPCGQQLDKLAQKSEKQFKIKINLKGDDCCLSGVENKCQKMLDDGYSKEDISRYCIEYIKLTLEEMTKNITQKYENLPLIYVGGVMSNSIISTYFKEKFNAKFAKREFSCDNAAGIAILSYYKDLLNGTEVK